MVSAATDADGDGVADDLELHNARSVHATVSPSRVLLDSRGKADRLLFDIDLAVEGLVINTTYFENGDIPEQTDRFIFTLHRLIEFTDVGGDGIYGPGVDADVSVIIPTSWSFKSYKDDSANTGLHVIELQAAIGSGTLDVVAYLGSTFGLAGTRLVTPAAIKFDATINGLTFSPTTELAAWMKVARNGTATLENETEVERLFSTSGETGIRFGAASGVRGSISWADQVTVVGSPVPVPTLHGPITQSTGGSPTTEHNVYITLAEGSRIGWDSRVGMDGIVDPDVPIAPPAPIPWEPVGLVAVVIITGIVSGALVGRYVARRRVEVLKSNKQGDPNANRGKVYPKVTRSDPSATEAGKVFAKVTRSDPGDEPGTIKGKVFPKVERNDPGSIAPTGSDKHVKLTVGDPYPEKYNLDGIAITADGQPLRPLKPNSQPGSPNPDLHVVEKIEVAIEKVERPRAASRDSGGSGGGGGGSGGSSYEGSKAQDHNSSRSNKSSSSAAPDEGEGGGSKAQDHNSSRSNKSSSSAAPDEDEGGGSKAQDHNSSRSNKSSSSAAPDAGDGGGSPDEKERGITINTSHVEYETKAVARAPGDTDYHRPPRLAPYAAETVHQELHRPPTNHAFDKTSAKLEEAKKKVSKIDAFTIKQGVMDDAAAKALNGDALSPAEASELGPLAQKLRYGNPLSDDEIDLVGKFLSHDKKSPVDAREVLSRRDSRTMLREGLDVVVKVIEKATSGLKDTLKTQV